jgi:hypothetical protein
MILNFLLSLSVSKTLHFLWGMVNALQMVVFTVIFDLYHPQLVKDFELTLIGFITADLFPTDEIYNYLFGFIKTEDFNQALADAEYGGSNFVMMMGTVPILTFGGILIALFQKLVLTIAIKTNKC